jgi:membrane fusion protein (multidrug efflux system)
MQPHLASSPSPASTCPAPAPTGSARHRGGLALRAGAGALALAFGLGLAACSKPEPPKPAARPPAEVRVIVSRTETVPAIQEQVGRVAAFRSVEVRARVEGILERRHFTEGTEVKRGQLLYTIDPTPYRTVLNDARAEVARAEDRKSVV